MTRQRIWYTAGFVALAFSVGVRIFSYHIVTSDYTYFLSKWYDALKAAPGLHAFASPFADYAPLYLYLMKGLTYLPFSSLYSIKTLSFFFDEVLAVLACLLLRLMLGPQPFARLFLSFTVVMAIPTVMLNSTLWAQSDSIYAVFVLASLCAMAAEAPLWAALFFAVAFAVKFQAVFFFPVLLGFLLRRQEWLTYLLLIPLVFVVSIIPAWINGGSFAYWFFVYITESTEYTALSVSGQSVFAFLGGAALSPEFTRVLFWAGLSAAALAALAITVMMARAARSGARRVLLLSLLCVLIIPFLLPRMHERYFYLADVLSVCLALCYPRQWYVAALIVGASLLSYMPYLSQLPAFAPFSFDLRIPAAMLATALVFIIWKLWREPEVEQLPALKSPPSLSA